MCAASIAVLILPASSLAAGHSQNGPTVGDCISDGLYGNEPNMANQVPGGPSEQEPGTKGGNVVPTQSTGPVREQPERSGQSAPAGGRGSVAAGWGRYP